MIEVGLGTVKRKNINFFLSRYQISIEVFIVHNKVTITNCVSNLILFLTAPFLHFLFHLKYGIYCTKIKQQT